MSQHESPSTSASVSSANAAKLDRLISPFSALLNSDISPLGPSYATAFHSIIDGNIEPSRLPILKWAQRFHCSLIAKFSLYNYKWLNVLENGRQKREEGSLMGLITASHHPLAAWYLQLIISFLALGNCDSACIVLILETDQLEKQDVCHYNNGYSCPKKPIINKDELLEHSAEERTIKSQQESFRIEGLQRWPAIFTHPPRKESKKHWPNLISLITDNRQRIRESIASCCYPRRKTRN
ncbi:unnamed protein product [Albugo candida]|uniref:Uncharacterized protein n=1 Tax=Albugo candida TaxID=65357 RepID=A0A024GNB7_9STRA|nr:unnamed protein product [Albugo candida]|eukprot:CCI48005.1 unnamed protein product [Albugo candida]